MRSVLARLACAAAAAAICTWSAVSQTEAAELRHPYHRFIRGCIHVQE